MLHLLQGPARKVTVKSFWIDETEVTNRKFAKFIEETKYTTEAETFGWSFVFHYFIPTEVCAFFFLWLMSLFF